MRTTSNTKKELKPNISEANRFLDTLCGSSRVTFQTIVDCKCSHDTKPLAKIFQGRCTGAYSKLEQLQKKGAGVFIMVNEGDGEGRTADNVVKVRAVFVDLDGAPLQPVQDAELPPHIIVETSPNKYHAYWLVNDCEIEQFTKVQKELAAKFGGDKSVSDLARVMRLPGFWHLKKPNKPFMTRILKVQEDLSPYLLNEIRERLLGNGKGNNKGASQPPAQGIIAGNPETLDWLDRLTGEVYDLRKWASNYPGFKIVDALCFRNPQVLIGEPKDGRQHIICVNSSAHTDNSPDNATFIINPQDSVTQGFAYHCMHDHCVGLDRLSAIKMMLEKGWLAWEDLIDNRFNIIRKPKHPKYVEYSPDDFNNMLQPLASHSEQAACLYLGSISLLSNHRGYLPNHDRRIMALLGIDAATWAEYRDNWTEFGLIVVDDDGIHFPYFLNIYNYAVAKYKNAAIKGAKGGERKRDNATPPKAPLKGRSTK